MTTALITHSACFAHDPPAGHPERPARLRTVLDSLSAFELQRIESPRADAESVSRGHDPALVSRILSFRGPDFARIDADTFMSAGSAEAALHAAGAVIAAVDGVMRGSFRSAFCAVRPPGHHAERAQAMGFCLFNNVAIGALHARAVHGLKRIAVVDFDVHHGNGTQDIFSPHPELFYASTHQMPLYPGTGFAAERGVADNVLNRPLPPGSGSAEFRAAYRNSVLPALEAFRPDFIFISAGFDAHRADPLASLALSEGDFGWVTGEICAAASSLCKGRIVSTLEGGYDLEALAASTAAHVRALIEG